MSDTIDWKARCEAAEAHNIKITREWSVQVTEMRKELERERKAAAEMREALLKLNGFRNQMANGLNWFGSAMQQPTNEANIKAAAAAFWDADKAFGAVLNEVLSADAGRDHHHRDAFKPMVEALQFYANCAPESGVRHKIAREALADARQKGLIP